MGDGLEREADTVAEGLMRLPHWASISVATAPPQIGRKYSARGGEGEMAADAGADADAPSIVHEVLRSPGKPLDEQARALMEPHLGRDFSRVRIHTDAAAARSAKEIHARAYTAGNNVVFASGQFSPRSPEGQTLLAHELTHVVQQGGEARLIQRAPAHAQTNEPTGPQVSQKPDPSAKNPVPSLSADDWIWVLETFRRRTPQEFVKVLAEKEGMFYPILKPYGFRGSWVKEEAYLDDFDAAVRKWGKSRIYNRKFGSLSQIAPPAKEKSREERQYQEAQWLVIDMNRHGYGRGQVNDALESAGLLDDLESHGFEKVGAYSFTPSETYEKRAVDALNQYIDRYRNAHNIKVPTSADVPAQGEDIEFYRAWLEGLSYVTSSLGAAVAAGIASRFTDDPEKITAAAGLGAAFESAAGAIGAMAGGRGSYSPEVVGPRDRPGAVGAWRYTGKQPIKTPVDPAKVGAPWGGQRAPIVADTDVLIQAFNDNSSALEEIRRGKTYITPVQYYEFMAQQAFRRQAFLKAEGIEVTSLGAPAPTLARAGDFFSVYSSVARVHSYGDAVLVTYGRLMNLEVVTMESRLVNFIRKTLHRPDIHIRQVEGAR